MINRNSVGIRALSLLTLVPYEAATHRWQGTFGALWVRLDASGLLMSLRPNEGAMTTTLVSNEEIVAEILMRLGKRSIVFVGLMGAGKTAIGRKVAATLGLPFLDSDQEIEAVSRMNIPDLFERYGEPEFRSLEQRVIARILDHGPQVLSTGGGAYINGQTRELVQELGVSVWLKADIEVLMERVSKKQNRPLLKNPDPRGVMQRLIAERYPVYAHADVKVETRDEKREVISQEVISSLHAHLSDGAATSGGSA
jgi:shikimate kinase